MTSLTFREMYIWVPHKKKSTRLPTASSRRPLAITALFYRCPNEQVQKYSLLSVTAVSSRIQHSNLVTSWLITNRFLGCVCQTCTKRITPTGRTPCATRSRCTHASVRGTTTRRSRDGEHPAFVVSIHIQWSESTFPLKYRYISNWVCKENLGNRRVADDFLMNR